MKSILTSFFFVFLAFFLSACATGDGFGVGQLPAKQTEEFLNNVDNNSVVIFRDTGEGAAGINLLVALNGQEVAELGYAQSRPLQIPAGTHELSFRFRGLANFGLTNKSYRFTK